MSLNLLILKSNLGKWMERRAIGFQMPYFSLLILYLRMFFVYDSSSEWIYMESHLFQCSWPENPKSKLQDMMQPPKINYGVLSFHCLNWDRSQLITYRWWGPNSVFWLKKKNPVSQIITHLHRLGIWSFIFLAMLDWRGISCWKVFPLYVWREFSAINLPSLCS